MRKFFKLIALMIVFGISLTFVCPQAKKEKAKKTTPKETVTKPAVPKASKPGKLTKQQDGHWSPYTAPVVPEKAKTHLVQKGDTLWALSKQYLSNPYLWPQIWEKNKYISDPHWIYPGDNILIEEPKLVEEPKPAETTSAAQPPPAQPAQPEEPTKAIRTVPRQKVSEKPISLVIPEMDIFYSTDKELYGTGRIYAEPPSLDTFIVGAEKEKTVRYLGNGDLVYVNKGMKQNVFPGAKFQILRSMAELKNPTNNRLSGYYYTEPGTVKVLIAKDDTAIATIDFSTNPVHIGDALIPFVEKAKLKRDKTHKFQKFWDDNGKPTGNLIYIEGNKDVAGSGEVVYLSIGKKNNVTNGQFCTVYSVLGKFAENGEYYPDWTITNFKEKRDKKFLNQSNNALEHRNVPRVVLGEVVIIDVFDNTAKAMVVESLKLFELGSYIQLQ